MLTPLIDKKIFPLKNNTTKRTSLCAKSMALTKGGTSKNKGLFYP